MEDLGAFAALLVALFMATLFVTGTSKIVHDSVLSSQCEFFNAAQVCHKVYLPENHEHFKEY